MWVQGVRWNEWMERVDGAGVGRFGVLRTCTGCVVMQRTHSSRSFVVGANERAPALRAKAR